MKEERIFTLHHQTIIQLVLQILKKFKTFMKTLKESILSSTKTGKSAFLIPKDKNELKQMIDKEIREKGYNCDLNHIKTHKITDMSHLFADSKFNGDISKWDVSRVENMSYMFYKSNFTGENGDISKWDVSRVENMEYMFYVSQFNGVISKWNVSRVKNMTKMFALSKRFNQDISKWKVQNVINMTSMFDCAEKFNQDISNWELHPNCITFLMFGGCKIEDIYKPFKNGERIE